LLLSAAVAVMLTACGQIVPPHLRPLPPETKALLAEKGMREDAPIFVRIFKEESELEVWKAKDDGRFYQFKTYPICNWSGKLGPKIKQGDKQAPEGFYTVSAKQMNPNSNYYLSFNLGFPNAYDKAHDRTGKFLMVHGDCRSAGCYAMTDALIEEIYALAREAFAGGQEAFQVQAFPFRMTPENMKRHAKDRAYRFWRDLQVGYKHFEYSRLPPKVDVCAKRYVVDVAFVDGGSRIDPKGACPVYEHLPLEKAPEPPMIQEARQEKAPKRKLPPHMAFAPVDKPADKPSTSQPSTAASQATIGHGTTFGFAPAMPSYSGFAFRNNATLGK
jgi:murein L,D-transpeptidase YafK